jgi:hypothetical protein
MSLMKLKEAIDIEGLAERREAFQEWFTTYTSKVTATREISNMEVEYFSGEVETLTQLLKKGMAHALVEHLLSNDAIDFREEQIGDHLILRGKLSFIKPS